MSAPGLAAHLSPAELGQRYRAARSPIARSHLQIVWLLSRGRGEREVAQVTGYGRRWVAEVVRRYDEDGLEGLGDWRRCGPCWPSHLPMVGGGPAPRWQRGWRPGSAARCGRSAGRTTLARLWPFGGRF